MPRRRRLALSSTMRPSAVGSDHVQRTRLAGNVKAERSALARTRADHLDRAPTSRLAGNHRNARPHDPMISRSRVTDSFTCARNTDGSCQPVPDTGEKRVYIEPVLLETMACHA